MLVACAPGYQGMPGATTTDPPTGVEGATAALAAARARWAGWGATDYSYRFTNDCGECDPQTNNPKQVAVLAGQVLSVDDGSLLTVDEIFLSIEEALTAGRLVEVTYDPETGLPVDVKIDMDMRPVDGGTHWILEELTDLAPVESAQQLLEARRLWETQGLDDYRFLMKVACECPERGTFDVSVVGDQIVDVTRLDAPSNTGTVTPVTIDQTFDDLEEWFSDSENLIDEGILDVDLRIDPVMGYPRWVKLEAAFLDAAAPSTVVVTMELVGPIDPGDSSPQPDPDDLAALEQARSVWKAQRLTDYGYTLNVHCNCPQEYVGPFAVTVRNTWNVSATWNGEPLEPGRAAVDTIDGVFVMIERAIQDGIDVDVNYDPHFGHPHLVIINPEAVAADGGLAFTIEKLAPLGTPGGLAWQVLAGPTCPVQQEPPDPACTDRPVQGAVLMVFDGKQREVTRITTNPNGSFQASLDPGTYRIEPQPVEGLLGTAMPFDVTIRPGATIEVTVTYDTGIR